MAYKLRHIKISSSTRYCSVCKEARPIAGGEWRVNTGGLTRRWFCSKHVKEQELEFTPSDLVAVK